MFLMIFTIVASAELTALEIIEKRDGNEYIRSAIVEATMIISRGSRRIEKTMVSYTKDKNALVEFTNPADRGSKFLKRNDNLWLFFPDAEEIVKISGHMLEQGFMGSDFSFQDVMESDKLVELYTFSLLGEEIFEERPCYIIEAAALSGKKVSYYRRKVWIDKERFVTLKGEVYTQSGRLLKVSKAEKLEEIDGRWLAVQSVMENKLRKNTYTQFTINKIDLSPELDDKIFSLQSLR